MSTVVTPEATLSFPNLFKAVPNKIDATKPAQFGCMLTINKSEDMTPIYAALNAAATAKWGANIPPSCKNPIKDGDVLAAQKGDPWYAGKWVINSTANLDYPPQVVGLDRQPLLDRTQIYAGCKVRVALNAFAYDTPMNKGVSLGLTAVMKVADGERLDNRVSVEQVFKGIEGAPAPLVQPQVGGFGAPAPVQTPAAQVGGFGAPAAQAAAPAVFNFG